MAEEVINESDLGAPVGDWGEFATGNTDKSKWGTSLTDPQELERRYRQERLEREREREREQMELAMEQIENSEKILNRTGTLRLNFSILSPGHFFQRILRPGQKVFNRRYVPLLDNQYQSVETTGEIISIGIEQVVIRFPLKNGKSRELSYDLLSIFDGADNFPKYIDIPNVMANTIQFLEIEKAPERRTVEPLRRAVVESQAIVVPQFNPTYQQELKSRLKIGDIVNVKRYIMNKTTGVQTLSLSENCSVTDINGNEFTIGIKTPTGKLFNFTYKFSNVVSENYNLPQTTENKSDARNLVQIVPMSKSGGVDPYYIKYLKYKAKYAKLKESM